MAQGGGAESESLRQPDSRIENREDGVMEKRRERNPEGSLPSRSLWRRVEVGGRRTWSEDAGFRRRQA
jgi:hypothetical protein